MLSLQAITEPLSDPIALAFIIIIGSYFMISTLVLLTRWQPGRALVKATPAALTTLGVLGTFAGIYVGLIDFDVKDIDGSIPSLLNGLKIAFFTSIVGMSCSILFKLFQSVFGGTSVEAGVTPEDIHAVLKDLRDGQSDTLENTKTLMTDVKNAIAGEGDSSLVTQIQKLRTSITDGNQEIKAATSRGFDNLIGEFKTFAEKMAENNSKALIEALKEVIRDFNAKISEQFGENFKQLNEAVGKLLGWQETYRVQMDEMNTQFNRSLEGITQTQVALSEIRTEAEAIPATMVTLRDVLTAIHHQTEELELHLEAFQSLRQQAQEALPVVNSNLEALTTSFASAVENSANKVSEILDDQRNSLDTAVSASVSSIDSSSEKHNNALIKFDELISTMTNDIEEMKGSLKSGVDAALLNVKEVLSETSHEHVEAIKSNIVDMRESFQKNLNDSNGAIQETLTSIEEELSEAVTGAGDSLKKTANEQADVMSSNVISMNESFQKNLGDSNEAIHETLTSIEEELTEAVTEVGSNLKQSAGEHADAMQANVTSMRDSFQQAVNDSNDVIKQSFQVFDEQMQDELKRSIELMGGHLASLSGKFVEDYTPLTEQLRNLVEVAETTRQ